MDDAEQSKGRASTAEESAGTSSTEVVEARPSRVSERVRDTNGRGGTPEEAVSPASARAKSPDFVKDSTAVRPADRASAAKPGGGAAESGKSGEGAAATTPGRVDTPTAESPSVDTGSVATLSVDAPDAATPDADAPADAESSADVDAEADVDGEAEARPTWRRRLPAWVELPLLVAVAMVIVLAVNSWVAQPFVIPSGSMENTLQVGDRVLVNKLAYQYGDIRRGDMIVFDGRGSFTPEDADKPDPFTGALRKLGGVFGFANPDDNDFVKRVIGIGGDVVKCCDAQGRVTVNGVPLDEGDYLHPGDKPSDFPFEAEVPKGKLWVMGDHRSNSADSRDHLGDPGGGMVPESRVIGRVQWIIWPFGRIQGADRPKTFNRSDFDRRG
ncbi:signal peptidase I [Embleya sp. AB8]|uniref:signal peptidase I n=1 Tax=Embleya sp. AB8 TaxID=3156304 RepID=UPI003C79627F